MNLIVNQQCAKLDLINKDQMLKSKINNNNIGELDPANATPSALVQSIQSKISEINTSLN